MPSPPSPAAKLGTELHRRIELHARGVAAVGGPPEDVEEPYDLDPAERKGGAEPVSAEQMWENFQQSRFAQMKPLMVEQPFTLYIGEGISIQGRIDAIFEREDGVWEVVDYKTGKSDPDPLQLAIYARAIEEIWGRRTQSSWLLLRTGEEQAAPAVEDLSQVPVPKIVQPAGGPRTRLGQELGSELEKRKHGGSDRRAVLRARRRSPTPTPDSARPDSRHTSYDVHIHRAEDHFGESERRTTVMSSSRRSRLLRSRYWRQGTGEM